MHRKCNALESCWNHSFPSLVHKKTSFHEISPWCWKGGGCWSRRHLIKPAPFSDCLKLLSVEILKFLLKIDVIYLESLIQCTMARNRQLVYEVFLKRKNNVNIHEKLYHNFQFTILRSKRIRQNGKWIHLFFIFMWKQDSLFLLLIWLLKKQQSKMKKKKCLVTLGNY